MGNPHWQSPGARAPEPPKKKEPRDYITPAVAALGSCIPTSAVQQPQLIAAIIIAQALDRFGEKLIDAAAVSQYKRDS